MANPWLSIIGIHPSGLQGLSAAALQDLNHAELVFGSPRHLELAQVGSRGRPWPVPFSVEPVLQLRQQRQVAMLVSGDPFHFGAGASIAKHLEKGEWHNHRCRLHFHGFPASWAGPGAYPLPGPACAQLRDDDAVAGRRPALYLPAARRRRRTEMAVWLTGQGWGHSLCG